MTTRLIRRFLLSLLSTLMLIHQAYGAVALTIGAGPNLGSYPLGTTQIPLNPSGGSGTYAWSVTAGALPPGINIAPVPYVANNPVGLAGVATTPGSYSFTLSVTDGSQSLSKAMTMKVTALTAKEVYNLPSAAAGQAYSYTFTPLNNAGNVTFAATSALPAGLSLSAGGTLSGTPAAGSYNITFSITDGVDTVYRGYNLRVFAIAISTASLLPNATANSPYNQVIAATGGVGTLTFSAGGGMPPGLTLSSTGAITGTVPAGTGGKYAFTVYVSDSAQNSSYRSFTIDVLLPVPLPMRIAPYGPEQKMEDATVGDAYTNGIGLCCGGTAPYTWSASGLPAGMSLRSTGMSDYVAGADAEIWGSAAVPGLYPFQVTVTDSAGATVTGNFMLTVSTLAVNVPGGIPGGNIGSPYNLSGWILGGKPGYTVTPGYGALPAGISQTLPGGGPALFISGTPTENGGFVLVDKVTDANGATFTHSTYINIGNVGGSGISVNNSGNLGIVTPGSYSNQLSACCVANVIWSVAGGSMPPGLSLTSSGLLTGTLSGAGSYTFLVKAADGASFANPGFRQFTLVVSPVTISGSLPYGNVGSPYSATLTANNATPPLIWSQGPGIAYLPPGLTLNSNGTITGTPLYAGRFDTVISVTDGNNNHGQRYFSITIYPAGAFPPVQINSGPNLGTFYTGTQQVQLGASGGNGAYTWSFASGTLPPGLALRTDVPTYFNSSQQAGLIGVATTPGTYNFTLNAASGGRTVSRAFSIRITSLNVMENLPTPDVFVNTPYSFQFTPVGNAGPVTFTAVTMPAGLSISSAGLLSGTPTNVGSQFVSFNLNDGTDTVNVNYTLPIYAVNITSPAILPNATQYTPYSQTLTATGGAGGYTYALNGSLPSGLALNATTGAITGTLTAGAQIYNFTITATDSNDVSYSKQFSLDVVGTPPFFCAPVSILPTTPPSGIAIAIQSMWDREE